MATTETSLVTLNQFTAVQLFAPGAINPIVERIKAEARAEAAKLDISTEVGRKAIASLAYKIARSKTFVDEKGKESVADKKREIKAVDEERGRIWDELEKLQAEIRKPLTDWENAEKERVERHEAALELIAEARSLPGLHTAADVESRIAYAEQLFNREWEEFAARAAQTKGATISALNASLELARKREAEQAELARLRKEAEERAIKEREEAAAKAAKEEAERKAEERARIAREAAERERQRVENERAEAEAKAKRAEAERVAAEERAARELREAEDRRRREAEAAEERRKREALEAERRQKEAVESAARAERERIEAEARRTEEEQRKREANRKHRAKVNGDALAAFKAAGIAEETARIIIDLIAKGAITHIQIEY